MPSSRSTNQIHFCLYVLKQMKTLRQKFCSCVKKVKGTVKLREGLPKNKEGAAIAICTKSMLYPRGLTMKKVKCLGKRPYLKTQSRRK
jgi:hypothetical protein